MCWPQKLRPQPEHLCKPHKSFLLLNKGSLHTSQFNKDLRTFIPCGEHFLLARWPVLYVNSLPFMFSSQILDEFLAADHVLSVPVKQSPDYFIPHISLPCVQKKSPGGGRANGHRLLKLRYILALADNFFPAILLPLNTYNPAFYSSG